MILADRLRSRHAVLPASRRVARPPVTLSGPLLQAARTLWIGMAVAGLVTAADSVLPAPNP